MKPFIAVIVVAIVIGGFVGAELMDSSFSITGAVVGGVGAAAVLLGLNAFFDAQKRGRKKEKLRKRKEREQKRREIEQKAREAEIRKREERRSYLEKRENYYRALSYEELENQWNKRGKLAPDEKTRLRVIFREVKGIKPANDGWHY